MRATKIQDGKYTIKNAEGIFQAYEMVKRGYWMVYKLDGPWVKTLTTLEDVKAWAS